MTPQQATPPEIGQSGASVLDAEAKSADLSVAYVCPECLARFKPKATRQLFCCADHKRGWHNRAAKRGAVLYALVMAARETRDGTRGVAYSQDSRATGKRASGQANMLMMDWRDEDRKAGRMGQVEYMRRRFAMGFDAI